MDKILFVLTGGTLDSIIKPRQIKVARAPPWVEEYMRRAKVAWKLGFARVCLKDSRELSDGDRKRMAEAIMRSGARRAVITHGTFTMVETARYLEKALGKRKTVVLTGSFVPLSQPESDAKFNLGYAVASAQLLPPGIYICMNGKTFKPGNARKNNAKNRFEETRK